MGTEIRRKLKHNHMLGSILSIDTGHSNVHLPSNSKRSSMSLPSSVSKPNWGSWNWSSLCALCSILVNSPMYSVASQITSIFVGFFSCGESGNKLFKTSIFSFISCTLFLSLALASLRCLLTPVKRGPRRFLFLLSSAKIETSNFSSMPVMFANHLHLILTWM